MLALPFLYPRLGKAGEALALSHMRRQVKDPALQKKLTPSYHIGCKRVLVSDDYFPSLDTPNVEVITEGIERIDERGVVTADGQHRAVDAIICGTGFHVTDTSYAKLVRGRDGRSLAECWAGSPRAHLGTTVHGFPNLFLLLGPNTALGHSSVVLMIEHQIEHVLGALRHLDAHGLATLEPRAEAQAAFVDVVDTRMRSTVWLQGGCRSWYLDETGRNSTLWPGYTFSFGRRVERFDPAEYTCEGRSPEAAQIRAA
jgi:cation diffusion facilitator CzcD-associated flavoprotein CzcO